MLQCQDILSIVADGNLLPDPWRHDCDTSRNAVTASFYKLVRTINATGKIYNQYLANFVSLE